MRITETLSYFGRDVQLAEKAATTYFKEREVLLLFNDTHHSKS